jgi:hypothetical protein
MSRPSPVLSVFRLIASLLLLATALRAASPAPPGLAGAWRIDPARSTELSPWRSLELRIAVDGERVSIKRSFSWGRRVFEEDLALDLRQPVARVPVAYWPDNRHLGAYIGGDKHKRVRAEWLDGRRVLRLSSDLVLETQQGPREVNILSDYKLSLSGGLLTLTEIRSTRQRPVVYVFTRIPSAPTP